MAINVNCNKLTLVAVAFLGTCLLFWCLWNRIPFHSRSDVNKSISSFFVDEEIAYSKMGRDRSKVNWNEVFKFVPNAIRNCKELFPGETKFPGNMDAKYDEYTHYVSKHVNVNEGHSGESREERRLLNELVRNPFVKTVCETGFNAGHSSFTHLESNPHVKVFSFDIGSHKYAHVMADYLQKQYPGRLTVTWGDSTKSIPEFQRKHPNISCDIIFIDGGHSTEVCLGDFYNFRKMAAPEHVVILDNYPERRFQFQDTIGNCWERCKRNGHATEIFNCNHDPVGLNALGFTVGRYT